MVVYYFDLSNLRLQGLQQFSGLKIDIYDQLF